MSEDKQEPQEVIIKKNTGRVVGGKRLNRTARARKTYVRTRAKVLQPVVKCHFTVQQHCVLWCRSFSRARDMCRCPVYNDCHPL